MHLEIRHRTVYSYETPARYSAQRLRLTPPSFEGQTIKTWDITAPGFETSACFRDGFGNMVHLVTIAEEHDTLTIDVAGTIETEDKSGIIRGIRETAPRHVYLRETELTKPDDAIRNLAKRTIGGLTQSKVLSGLHDLMDEVRHKIDYEIGTTAQSTTAAEALTRGTGVCQDHAHVFIAAARSADIPSRYVNGYFHLGTTDASDAHHAWAEAWVEGLGWVGFDPANKMCPTDRYVRLSCGLDAESAAPIRGSQHGGTNETLDVTVEVTVKDDDTPKDSGGMSQKQSQ